MDTPQLQAQQQIVKLEQKHAQHATGGRLPLFESGGGPMQSQVT